jgi:hypothetical protein
MAPSFPHSDRATDPTRGARAKGSGGGGPSALSARASQGRPAPRGGVHTARRTGPARTGVAVAGRRPPHRAAPGRHGAGPVPATHRAADPAVGRRPWSRQCPAAGANLRILRPGGFGCSRPNWGAAAAAAGAAAAAMITALALVAALSRKKYRRDAALRVSALPLGRDTLIPLTPAGWWPSARMWRRRRRGVGSAPTPSHRSACAAPPERSQINPVAWNEPRPLGRSWAVVGPYKSEDGKEPDGA